MLEHGESVFETARIPFLYNYMYNTYGFRQARASKENIMSMYFACIETKKYVPWKVM